MYVFKNFLGKHAPGPPQKPLLFFNELQISFAEKNTLEHNAEIMPPLTL